MKVPIISATRSEIISIIGSGFAGTAAGKGFEQLCYKVIFYDIQEKDLPNSTQDLDQAIHSSNVSSICVPTPTLTNGGIDPSYLKSSVPGIGKNLRHKDGYHLIVVKSTILPTTTEVIVIPELEKASAKKAETDFGICTNPEFMTEISHTWSDDATSARSFFTGDRVVIGEHDQKSGDLLEGITSNVGALVEKEFTY